MPGITWDDVNQLSDPAISWRFLCELPEVAGVTTPRNVQVEKINAPHMTIEPGPHYAAGKNIYFAKDRAVSGLTFTFYEETNYAVYEYLMAWLALVVDEEGNYGLPRDYKKVMRVSMLDERGEVRLRLQYLGCWPTSPAEYMLDSESAQRIMTVCQFSTDLVKKQD